MNHGRLDLAAQVLRLTRVLAVARQALILFLRGGSWEDAFGIRVAEARMDGPDELLTPWEQAKDEAGI